MSGRVWVATRKGVFRVDRNGKGWKIAQVSFLGEHSPMLLPDARDGSVYAALELGHFGSKLQRSEDGGASWREIAAPTYPKPEPGEENQDQWGKTIAWKLEKVWSLAAGRAEEAGTLWCGTIPGGLFRSPDGGATWELVRSLWDHPKRKEWVGGGADLPGIHSICVHPDDERHLSLGVSCGGVWVSPDGGASWESRASGMRAAYMPPECAYDPNVQDPHCVVQCRAEPDCLWAQHHNGIFRTTDGGREWREVTDVPVSAFGFAVAVHPRDPHTAWFVPGVKDECRIPVDGRLVVTRTRDGGASFEVLARGLPQQHAYDVVFRHALDVDDTGDRLAFGSTTGSLWVSEDQGDSWDCVSEHLPPVYCVRFEKAP